MASNQNTSLLQCSGCCENLNFESKTLPCLHSFCPSCSDRVLKGEADENQCCPECHEILQFDELSLSPLLVKLLRRQQLESADIKCELCLDDGIKSRATHLCTDCQKPYCANCRKWHEKFQKNFKGEHNFADLDGMGNDELIDLMTKDLCHLHQKIKDAYCGRCNVCFCGICYKTHTIDSPGCLSEPLSVEDEVLRQKSRGPILVKEMVDLIASLKRLNGRTQNYTTELNDECDTKCRELWDDLEEMIENAKQKTRELCEDMRQVTAEQVKKWNQLIEENNNILKQLEIWHLNLQHLLDGTQQAVDLICSLRVLESKLSSKSQELIRPEEKCRLEFSLPDWWLKIREQLKTNEKIGSVTLMVEELSAQNLVCYDQWSPCCPNSSIMSIHVSKEDNHIFLCDEGNYLIRELTENGDFVCDCILRVTKEGEQKFQPFDMCSISQDILIVACGNQDRLILLERRKKHPQLQIKKIIPTDWRYFSLCQIKDSILSSDGYFQVDSLTKEGELIGTIKTKQELWCKHSRICADPHRGNFWQTDLKSLEISYFNISGDEIRTVKTGEEISDICTNQFGQLYFCSQEGIFSSCPERLLHKFDGKSEHLPKMSILKNKMFVSVLINGIYSIKIFKILN